MRMKLKKPGQLVLVSAASLAAAGLLTACSQLTATLTVDFVYVSSAKAAGPDNYGEVDVFERILRGWADGLRLLDRRLARNTKSL